MSYSPTSNETATSPNFNQQGKNGGAYNLGAEGDDIEEGRPQRPTGAIHTAQPTAKDTPLITVQPIKRSELQPSYAQDLGTDALTHSFYGSMINCLGAVAGGLGSIPLCFCCPNPYKEVQQGSVGLVTRFGQLKSTNDPGLLKLNPFSEKLRIVDVKIQLCQIPRQNIITRDNVTVEVDSVVYYHVVSPHKAAFGISDVRLALVERAQTTLRHVVGSRNLQNLLTDREAVAAEVEQIVEEVSGTWGVKVESLLLKDILFSEELQQSLSSAAAAKRVGEAKVIAARAEVDSAKLMREAADILSSPAAIQIRQLEALQAMARTSDAKTIFIPMNLVGGGSNGDGLGNTALIQQLSQA
ncbi:hypothetical protein BCR35DRAFT_349604 [Leucosporidium creatinivorum]|uniref:Band 7 domain-containing protein n=1 Tax=Leucosporidium creatinivorum TaxID=106004 RepID=A0A1Y2G170_9BASI|nr:hypothetical protein BCR35DRAFT_349604 [Leucosporidium creatinivorum]